MAHLQCWAGPVRRPDHRQRRQPLDPANVRKASNSARRGSDLKNLVQIVAGPWAIGQRKVRQPLQGDDRPTLFVVTIAEQPAEPRVRVYPPEEALRRAQPLPPRDRLVIGDVPQDDWEAFREALDEV
jgi:hypothetical protein